MARLENGMWELLPSTFSKSLSLMHQVFLICITNIPQTINHTEISGALCRNFCQDQRKCWQSLLRFDERDSVRTFCGNSNAINLDLYISGVEKCRTILKARLEARSLGRKGNVAYFSSFSQNNVAPANASKLYHYLGDQTCNNSWQQRHRTMSNLWSSHFRHFH